MVRAGMGFVLAMLFVLLPTTQKAPLAAQEQTGVEVGSTAPDFTTTHLLTKTPLPFHDSFEGNPTLLIFIQTACRACHREMQFVQKLLVQYPELRAFVIFIDLRDDQIEKYVNETELNRLCCIAWDEGDRIAASYGVTFSPVTFLIDGQHTIRKIYKGFHRGSDRAMKADVEELLGK